MRSHSEQGAHEQAQTWGSFHGRQYSRRGGPHPWPELYGRVVRALLADQIRSAEDPQHQRLVSEENGLTSLEIAVEADELVRKAKAQPNSTRS